MQNDLDGNKSGFRSGQRDPKMQLSAERMDLKIRTMEWFGIKIQ